jgi:hypothetical protein
MPAESLPAVSADRTEDAGPQMTIMRTAANNSRADLFPDNTPLIPTAHLLMVIYLSGRARPGRPDEEFGLDINIFNRGDMMCQCFDSL